MVLTASGRVLARLLVAAVAALAVACGNDESGAMIAVGAGDSAESRVLAEIYAGALARTGARVSVEERLGQRDAQLAALDSGRVALLGEHSGALLAFLDSSSQARVPEKVTAALNRALPEGLAVADPADGTDMRPRVLLTAESATRDGVRALGDLAPRCGTLTAGTAPVPGLLELPAALNQVPSCPFAGTASLSGPELVRRALLNGDAQVGVLSGPPTVDPAVLDGLVVLADPDYVLRAQNVLPVYRKGALDERRVKKLNYVAGELTTDELVAMVRRVLEQQAAPAELARAWLDAHGL
ncbi:ABC transporter substrate-binding protein [Nocardia sp. NPDC052566]|uniref:ABC transporter substrate-binding protein n=1 Tax=Nocardia sp. NPDC052566 TaxID=3364330 RepID=UPI0037C9FBC3